MFAFEQMTRTRDVDPNRVQRLERHRRPDPQSHFSDLLQSIDDALARHRSNIQPFDSELSLSKCLARIDAQFSSRGVDGIQSGFDIQHRVWGFHHHNGTRASRSIGERGLWCRARARELDEQIRQNGSDDSARAHAGNSSVLRACGRR